MKLVCKQEDLVSALSIAVGATATRTTLPVLQHVLLTAEPPAEAIGDGTLSVAATDLEIYVRIALSGVPVTAPGSLTVPARLFAQLVGQAGAGSLSLDATDKRLQMVAAGTKSQLATIPADEFPTAPADGDGPRWILDRAFLRDTLKHVSFAAASDDTRPILHGIQFTFLGGGLRLAAADGFRLALDECGTEAGNEEKSFVLPLKAVKQIESLLKTSSADRVTISLPEKGNTARFSLDAVQLSARLIEGSYPNVAQIIPSESTRTVHVETAALRRAVKTAMLIAGHANSIVRLAIEPSGAQTTVSAVGDEGETETVVWPVTVDGEQEPLTIAFNGDYLGAALDAVDSQKAALRLNGPSSPGLIVPDDADSPMRQIIMPMHVAKG